MDPARRIAVSATAQVTTPETEECHQRPMRLPIKRSTSKLPMALSPMRLSVERPEGRKRSKRKAKLKTPPAETGGRDADLV
jgi:hypothetical protein